MSSMQGMPLAPPAPPAPVQAAPTTGGGGGEQPNALREVASRPEVKAEIDRILALNQINE